ncbi:MAG: hypothetical protein H0T65_20640 [Deltaproteobacteria bacterium]|nr:hypothetical protein [Deltaproteobacteria bacterium]
MKKQSGKKLSLKAETVMSLQQGDLAAVQGGATPAAIFTASVRFCAAVGQFALNSAQRSCITCQCRR